MRFAVLNHIDNDHKITKDTDFEFLYALENSLLLALKEQGMLTELQLKIAVRKLKAQRGRRAEGEGGYK